MISALVNGIQNNVGLELLNPWPMDQRQIQYIDLEESILLSSIITLHKYVNTEKVALVPETRSPFINLQK